MISFTPHTPPPLSRPWGTSLHWDLKKKADSSSTQPPLSESAKKWVPKISTDGPLNTEKNNFLKIVITFL